MRRQTMTTKALSILREYQVKGRTGLSASTVWRLEKNGSFPKRVQLSKNAVGWYEHEIESWIETRRSNCEHKHAINT